MWRYLAGGVAALLMVAAGWALFSGRARTDAVLPAQPLAATGTQATADDAPLPASVPEASEKTREQKRFDRYDKDRNGQITKEEYLAQRRKAYAKLDANHDGQLSFDEWAAKTTARFTGADRDASGAMSAAEFVATKPRRVARPRCACPPAAAAAAAAAKGEEE